MWIFGSRARGDYRPNSDVDLALEIDPIGNDEDALTSWVSESSGWRTQLSAIIPGEVDLDLYDSSDAHSVVKDAVDREGLLVYACAAKRPE